jgi:hypothetical protein
MEVEVEVEVVVVEHDNLEPMVEPMEVDEREDEYEQLQQHQQTRKRCWLELEFSISTIHDKSWASSARKRTKVTEEEEERAHQQRKRCWLEFSTTTVRDKSWDSCSQPLSKRAKNVEENNVTVEVSERPATRPHRQHKGKRCHMERG